MHGSVGTSCAVADRGPEDQAPVGVAAALDVSDGRIRAARIGLTGPCSHAIRLANVEEALAGQVASTETIDAAPKLAGSDLTAIGADIHGGEEYRRAMIAVFTRRALARALACAGHHSAV
jgi:carbon-monoxide dehydrogenase medium subunit